MEVKKRSMNSSNRTLRVLACPAYKNKSSNPYNYLLCSALERKGVTVSEFSFFNCLKLRYDIVHVHWPELYLNSASFLKAFLFSAILIASLAWSKLFGKKIVWTVHNLRPHKVKYGTLNSLFWYFYLPLVDGFISLSGANLKLIRDEYPKLSNVPSAVTLHGLYNGHYPDNLTRSEARTKLSISSERKVCLLMGQLRPYKNIELLIDVFGSADLSGVDLLVVGRSVDSDYSEELKQLASGKSNVRIIEKYVDDADIQIYMKSVDLMVLPFRRIFNSGSALLSVSFGIPTLVPNTPNFVEYQNILQDLIFCFDGELESKDILQALEQTEPNMLVEAESLTWDDIAGKTYDFYKSVVVDVKSS